MKHTKEPWPWFIDIAEQIHPVHDIQVAIISPDDYIRARICVNACSGLTNKQLASGYIQKLLRDNKECKKIIHDINETTIISLNELIKRQAV
jgi:hypothetical protein